MKIKRISPKNLKAKHYYKMMAGGNWVFFDVTAKLKPSMQTGEGTCFRYDIDVEKITSYKGAEIETGIEKGLNNDYWILYDDDVYEIKENRALMDKLHKELHSLSLAITSLFHTRKAI